jgi:ABC-type dipeptide/oligopeptide/nickel transport system permease subunit
MSGLAGIDGTAPVATARRRASDLLGVPGMLGAGLLVLITGFALYGLTLPDGAARERVAEPYALPQAGLPLGTDDIGRDLFAQLASGASVSLTVGLLVALTVTVVAAVVGGAAGLGPRWLQTLLMRGADIVLVLPELVLIVVAVAFLGQSFGLRIAIMAVIMWPVPSRVLRSAVLTVWARGHLEVAKAMGAPPWWLLVRHASYVLGPLLIPVFVRTAMRAVLYDATLSFLGLGDPATASWGTTLYWAQTSGAFLSDSWLWWAVPPGLAITLTVVGFALVGVAVEDRLNPNLREMRR